MTPNALWTCSKLESMHEHVVYTGTHETKDWNSGSSGLASLDPK